MFIELMLLFIVAKNVKTKIWIISKAEARESEAEVIGKAAASASLFQSS